MDADLRAVCANAADANGRATDACLRASASRLESRERASERMEQRIEREHLDALVRADHSRRSTERTVVGSKIVGVKHRGRATIRLARASSASRRRDFRSQLREGSIPVEGSTDLSEPQPI